MNNMTKLAFTAGCALITLACDDNPSSSSGNNHTGTLVLGMAVDNATLYGTTSLEASSENGSDFYEHSNKSLPFAYASWIFVAEVLDGTDDITRYTLDDRNKMSAPAALKFPGGSNPAGMFFVNTEKAYVSLNGAGKLAIINPATMKQTGSIDLTAHAAGGDGNPDPSSGIIRDGLLYLALSQRATQMSAHDTVAQVAIIDIAADTVLKVISDKRAASLGGADDADRTVILDEKGDIYFYSNAVWGYQPTINDGFLRIRKGTTEFDPDYYFSIAKTKISGVKGEQANYGLAFAYAENGLVYSMLQIPALTSNPPDYVKDRNYQPVEIDLYNKTIRALPIDPSPGYAAMGVAMETDDAVLFGLSIATGNGIYRYNRSTNSLETEPALPITGVPMTLKMLQE